MTSTFRLLAEVVAVQTMPWICISDVVLAVCKSLEHATGKAFQAHAVRATVPQSRQTPTASSAPQYAHTLLTRQAGNGVKHGTLPVILICSKLLKPRHEVHHVAQ